MFGYIINTMLTNECFPKKKCSMEFVGYTYAPLEK